MKWFSRTWIPRRSVIVGALLLATGDPGQQGPALINFDAHMDDHVLVALDPQFKNPGFDGTVAGDPFDAPFLVGGNPGRGPCAKGQADRIASANSNKRQQKK